MKLAVARDSKAGPSPCRSAGWSARKCRRNRRSHRRDWRRIGTRPRSPKRDSTTEQNQRVVSAIVESDSGISLFFLPEYSGRTFSPDRPGWSSAFWNRKWRSAASPLAERSDTEEVRKTKRAQLSFRIRWSTTRTCRDSSSRMKSSMSGRARSARSV